MIKRTIEISREPVHLAVRHDQLVIQRKDRTRTDNQARADPTVLATIPCEDLGVLMVDQRETTYTHAVLAALARHGAAMVICGEDHHPAGMYLPITTNTELLARLDAQLSVSKPVRKRLWSTIVRAKVEAQAALLPQGGPEENARGKMLELARRIRSGDPENIEAQAAAVYWPAVFARAGDIRHPFRRRPGEPDAPAPNNLLDYGYSALRAGVARALVSAGLLPALGIRHRGRSNPFCLADDLVEPLRPLIDARVRRLAESGEHVLDQAIKADLLEVLTEEVDVGGRRGPLLVGLSRYIASVVRVMTGETLEPLIPIARWRVEEPATPRSTATRPGQGQPRRRTASASADAVDDAGNGDGDDLAEDGHEWI